VTIEQRVKRFIVENFYLSESEIDDETPLIERGFIDSTGMLELIAFLESEFDFRIADTETTPENLATISRIGAFVSRRQRALAG
jgi:acyl carrier protein